MMLWDSAGKEILESLSMGKMKGRKGAEGVEGHHHHQQANVVIIINKQTIQLTSQHTRQNHIMNRNSCHHENTGIN